MCLGLPRLRNERVICRSPRDSLPGKHRIAEKNLGHAKSAKISDGICAVCVCVCIRILENKQTCMYTPFIDVGPVILPTLGGLELESPNPQP